MCEAHAFLLKNGHEEKILENVDRVEFDGDEVRLENIFGEQKKITARLKIYDNSQRKIVFDAL